MAGWIDPRPNDFSIEGLRARFKSLQDWLSNPEFNDGVLLGNGTPATYDNATGTTTPPTPTEVTSDNIAIFAQEALQSDNYDGTNVATGDATQGWRIERNTGSAEFGDARIRGSVTASEFRAANPTNLCANPSFETDTAGWTAGASTTIARVGAEYAVTPKDGSWHLRILSSSGSGYRYATYTVAVAPGDVLHVEAMFELATMLYGYTYDIVFNFYDAGATLLKTVSRKELAVNANGQRITKTFAVPVGDIWDDVVSCTIEFGGYSVGSGAGAGLYLDDVFIGKAPMLEVPYIVTNEDATYARGLVTPDHIGFQRNAANETGMRDVSGNLEVWGPQAGGGTTPKIQLKASDDGVAAQSLMLGDAAFLGITNNRVYPAVVCRARRWTTNQSLSNNVDTTIVFNEVDEDSDSAYNSSTGDYTVPVSGLYSIGATLRFQTNSTGIRQGVIRVNGNAMAVSRGEAALWGAEALVSVFWIDRLAAGAVVRVSGLQTSGGSLNVRPSSSAGTNFRIIRLGE